MKCEKCVFLGLKSTVKIERSMLCCLVLHIPMEYYDEDDKHHYHGNPCNKYPDIAHCSNGHNWKIVRVDTCWCGWKSSDQNPIEWLEDAPPVTLENCTIHVVRFERFGQWGNQDAKITVDGIND